MISLIPRLSSISLDTLVHYDYLIFIARKNFKKLVSAIKKEQETRGKRVINPPASIKCSREVEDAKYLKIHRPSVKDLKCTSCSPSKRAIA